jgi:predicted dehydrogenase
MTKIAVIGCGYWGPNLIRNFYSIPDSQMDICCDKDAQRLRHIKQLYPHVRTTQDAEDIFKDKTIDAVCIATPISTHYQLAKKALTANKHILVEKPFTSDSGQAEELISMARKKKRIIMVGHTFEYSAPVNKIKEILKAGQIGDILYISAARLNLGLFQKDINVIWDLAPHDISILNYLLEAEPLDVQATGSSCVREGIEDVALVAMRYPKNIFTYLHTSWLDPCKVRRFVIVGSKKMIVYDDVNAEEPIKIYDKGVSKQPHYDTFGEFKLLYRFGDTYSPRIETKEPLRQECLHFLDCINTGKQPRSDGKSGLKVVRIIEAAQRSLKNNGAREKV